jgi:hypothetical protein
MSPMVRFISIPALAFVASANALAAPTTAQDTQDVEHVMHAFHEAVVHHDGERLSALFLPQANLFLNVLGDDRWATARAKSPDAAKVRVSSPAEFAHYVSTTKSALDPVHNHLQVLSDGIIATVYFDFVFNTDGKASNVGNETWQLVKGEQGWRIAALTYSSRVPSVQHGTSP